MQPAPGAVPDGPAALDRLREQIVGVDGEMRELISRRQALVDDYERVRYALMGVPPGLYPSAQPGYPQSAPAAPPRQEWSGARVRGLLLGLGAALLAISALAFTAVAWSRLGEDGRAVLLVAVTAVVTGLALALRRRLPASAEALAGLAVVLSLIDVYALRRAGAGGMSWEVWWAIGTAAAAGFAAALSRFVGARTTRLAAAILAPVAPELLILRFATPEWVAGAAFAALAAVLMFARIGLGPRLAAREHGVLQLHAVGCWMVAALLAVRAAGQPQTTGAAIGPAFAVAMLAAAPAVARRDSTDAGLRAVAATLLAGVPAGVVLTLAGPALNGQALLTAAVIAGGATVLASQLAPAVLRAPALVAGAAFAVPGTVAAVVAALPSVAGPLAWLEQPWTGSLTDSARDAERFTTRVQSLAARDPLLNGYLLGETPAAPAQGLAAA
jgi:MFS family permease